MAASGATYCAPMLAWCVVASWNPEPSRARSAWSFGMREVPTATSRSVVADSVFPDGLSQVKLRFSSMSGIPLPCYLQAFQACSECWSAKRQKEQSQHGPSAKMQALLPRKDEQLIQKAVLPRMRWPFSRVLLWASLAIRPGSFSGAGPDAWSPPPLAARGRPVKFRPGTPTACGLAPPTACGLTRLVQGTLCPGDLGSMARQQRLG